MPIVYRRKRGIITKQMKRVPGVIVHLAMDFLTMMNFIETTKTM